MSIIIPYDEKIYKNDGAFISPTGEIIFTFGEHEMFSRDFCNGKDYELLLDTKYGSGWSYYASHFEEFKKDYNFEGEREDIDIYKSTKLTKEQLELFKLWLDNYEFSSRHLYSDFMVYLLGFDKVETVMRRAITTTTQKPHIRFYNYYLMDWHISHQTPMIFNKDTERFEYIERKDWALVTKEDREFESEINEIKAKTLLRDRPQFFKKS